MKNRTFIILGILFLLSLLGGISIGVFVKNFPIVQFDNKVATLNILTFLTTLGIGIGFPFLIKKWMDDNQSIKKYLVSEIEELIKEIKVNKKIIEDSYSMGAFVKEDRDSINFTFHSAELQIDSIQKQFAVSFPKSNSILVEMKNAYREYKDYLTGGELMISTFNKIELSFHREHSNEYNKFESHLKEMIQKIHRI